MFKSTHLRYFRPWIFWSAILLYTLIPGSSYLLVAQATFRLDLFSNKKHLKRIKRYLRIIYTSPKRVIIICLLDFFLTNGIIIAIIFAVINFFNL